MNFKDLVLVAAVIGLLALLIWAAIESERSFEVEMATEYSRCIASNETVYTCKAYINSMQAQRAAESAAASAAAAGINSGIAIGLAAGSSGRNR